MMTASSEGQEVNASDNLVAYFVDPPQPVLYAAGPEFENTMNNVDGGETAVPVMMYATAALDDPANPEYQYDNIPLTLASPGGMVGGVEGCPSLPGCCEEDCCGKGTLWQSPSCILEPNSAGFNGTHSSAWKEGCIERACCESDCCSPGTVYDSSSALCVTA